MYILNVILNRIAILDIVVLFVSILGLIMILIYLDGRISDSTLLFQTTSIFSFTVVARFELATPF